MKEVKSILIIEGIKAANAMVKGYLNSREELDVMSTFSGIDAINKYIGKEDLDLIIAAIVLPDINGVELIKRIRSKKKETPIIILANDEDKNKIVMAAEYKIDAVIKKPVKKEFLMNKVDSILYPEVEEDENDKSKISKEDMQALNELAEIKIDKSLPKKAIMLKKKIKAMSNDLISIVNNEKVQAKIDDAVWEKTTDCPVCGTQFKTLNYRRKSFPAIKKESDFHEVYEHINPLIFDIWVCPNCFYASKKEDFDALGTNEKAKLSKDSSKRKEVAKNTDFSGKRTNEVGILSYRLAVMCYGHRKPTNGFYGSIYLKAGWLAREIEDREQEKEFLKMVIHHYEKALNEGEKISGQLSELGLIYLLGETYRRTGDLDKAGQYFMKVKQDPDSKKEKAILKMADTQLELVKKQKAKKKK